MTIEYYCGLDIHKDKYFGCLLNKDGTEIRVGAFKPTFEELQQYFSGIGNTQCIVIIENCTGWMYAYKLISKLGMKTKLADSNATKKLVGKKKTDYYDAKALADLARSNLLPELYIPNDKILEYRDLTHHLKGLREHKTKLKNQIKSELQKNGIKYTGENLWTIKGFAWLKLLKNPVIDSYIIIHNSIEIQDKKVFAEIEKISKKLKQTQLLMTIVGVGPYLALIIYSEIADITRFKSIKSLNMYTGLCPGVYQTGNTKFDVKNNKCNHFLKWALHMASGRAMMVKTSNIFKKRYKFYLKKGMGTARRIIARDMLHIIWHMLNKNEEFIP